MQRVIENWYSALRHKQSYCSNRMEGISFPLFTSFPLPSLFPSLPSPAAFSYLPPPSRPSFSSFSREHERCHAPRSPWSLSMPISLVVSFKPFSHSDQVIYIYKIIIHLAPPHPISFHHSSNTCAVLLYCPSKYHSDSPLHDDRPSIQQHSKVFLLLLLLSSILYPPSSFLHPPSSILHPPSSFQF